MIEDIKELLPCTSEIREGHYCGIYSARIP